MVLTRFGVVFTHPSNPVAPGIPRPNDDLSPTPLRTFLPHGLGSLLAGVGIQPARISSTWASRSFAGCRDV